MYQIVVITSMNTILKEKVMEEFVWIVYLVASIARKERFVLCVKQDGQYMEEFVMKIVLL